MLHPPTAAKAEPEALIPLLLDTGAIYALADVDDAWHHPVLDLLQDRRDLLLTPVTVVPEATYLLRSRLGADAELRFVRSLASQELATEMLMPDDLSRTVELLHQYPQIGFVDASLVAVAERLRLREVVTTDRRHFAVIRPAHAQAFVLLP